MTTETSSWHIRSLPDWIIRVLDLEHAYLRDSGRAQYVSITDVEAMDALMELCRLEGIIPAIESAHAVAYAKKMAKTMKKDDIMIVCLSGRGDKDVNTISDYLAGKGYLN